MTLQQRDLLRTRGRTFHLLDLPLCSCLDPEVHARMARLVPTSSALWRGYRATWGIDQGLLWLCDLTASVGDGTGDRASVQQRGMAWLFPGQAVPVLADWFSGELTSARGQAVRFGSFGLAWPYLRRYTVAVGVITGTVLIDNRKQLRADLKRPSAAELVERLSRPLP